MAELEFAALARQRPDHRLASQADLEREVLAWQAERNTAATSIQWTFTLAEARQKLKRHYPSVNPSTQMVRLLG